MIRSAHHRAFSVVCVTCAAGASLALAHPAWQNHTLTDSIQQTVDSRRHPTVPATPTPVCAAKRSGETAKRWEVRLRDSKQRTLVVVIEAKSSSHARKVAKAQFPSYRIGSVREIKPN
jgi:hypothetical protein